MLTFKPIIFYEDEEGKPYTHLTIKVGDKITDGRVIIKVDKRKDPIFTSTRHYPTFDANCPRPSDEAIASGANIPPEDC